MLNAAESSARRTVLMVSYSYAPMGSPGALRVSKFAKYLPENGWNPVVVTTRAGYCKADGLHGDVDLPGVTVVRSYDFGGVKRSLAAPSHSNAKGAKQTLTRAFKALMIPDRDISWYPFGVSTALRAAREHRVDAVYSTSPNVTNHLVAGRVARRYGLPWIVDIRDLWTIDHYYARTGLRKRIEQRMERRILREAAKIVIVSEGMRDQLIAAFPHLAEKTSVIRNGFDPDDCPSQPPSIPALPFRLTYAGMFYGGRRNIEGLLSALQTLKQRGVVNADNFRFDVVGLPEPYVTDNVAKYGVGDLVHMVGYLPAKETLSYLAGSHATLVITYSDEASRGNMPTKVYEYLGLGRPILALTPEDYELAAFVRSYNTGSVIHPADSQRIAAWIESEVGRATVDGARPSFDAALTRQFSRAEGAAQLASILDDTVPSGRRDAALLASS